MTRTRTPQDPPSPVPPHALDPPSVRRAPPNLRPAQDLEAHIESKRAEFDRLMKLLLPQLEAAARALAHEREDARDLVQETMWRAWKYDTLATCVGEQRRFLVYLLKIMDNRWKTELSERHAGGVGERGARYHVHVSATVGDSAAPEEETESSDLRAHFRRAFARLPQQCRRALALVAGGMSYRETAEIMDVSVSTVPVYLKRGKRLVRKYLEAAGLQLPGKTKRGAKEKAP